LILLPTTLVVQAEQSVQRVCVSVCQDLNFWTKWPLTSLSCWFMLVWYIKFEGEGDRSEFTVTGWKMFLVCAKVLSVSLSEGFLILCIFWFCTQCSQDNRLAQRYLSIKRHLCTRSEFNQSIITVVFWGFLPVRPLNSSEILLCGKLTNSCSKVVFGGSELPGTTFGQERMRWASF